MSKQVEELKNIIRSMEVEQLRDMLTDSIDHGYYKLVHTDEESDVYEISIKVGL
jgi:hypothetical protein